MTQTVLITGASGNIGRHFAKAFEAAGWRVRRYQRGTDLNAAATGCDVIVNGMNPSAYHDWKTLQPQITAQVIEAARASGAVILFPGNVYVYGTQPGPWSAETPQIPASRKGQIRVEVEATYRAAAAQGVRTILLRAGDFIDPDEANTWMDHGYLRAIHKGKVTSVGDPQARRAHAYLPDMARAAVALAERRAELPAFIDIPFDGYTFSTADLTARLSRLMGRDLTITGFPWWMIRLASPFWELARELYEMRYLYDHPHTLSGEALARLIPDFQPTPMDDALRMVMARRLPGAVRA